MIMRTQSRRGIRALILFLLIMAALTFLSKTIYNGTLPCVETVRVKDGTLNLTLSGSDFLIEADDLKTLYVPEKLSDTPLRVECIYVQKLDYFAKGDALLRFDSATGEYALDTAMRAQKACREAMEVWNHQWQQAWDALRLERIQLEAEARDGSADARSVAMRREQLREAQRILEQDKAVNGVYKSTLEEDLRLADQTFQTLSALQENLWTIYAEGNGFAADVLAQPDMDYAGLTALIRWYSAEDATLRLGIPCARELDEGMLDNVRVYSVDRSTLRISDTEWEFSGVRAANGQRVLWARATNGLSGLSKLQSLCFEMRSAYYPCLVPNDAVIGGNRVYVLETRTGAWGNQETVARAVTFSQAQSDDQYTAIVGGIGADSQVIVRWDRAFSDGDAVFVQ